MIKKIIRNTFYLIFSHGLTRVVGFFYTIFLMQNLTVDQFGLYSVALSYFSIFSAIADFGIIRYLVRELSNKEVKTGQILGDVFFLRVGLTILLFVIGSLGLTIFDEDLSRSSLAVMALIALIPQAVAFSFDGVFIAQQKLHLSAIGQIILSVSSVIIGVSLINHGLGVQAPVFGLIGAHIIYAIFMLVIIFLIRTPFNLSIPNFKRTKQIMYASLPYGILAGLGLLYFRIDTVLLSYIRGSYETGLYAAAYKFLEAIIFIPAALGSAIFPVFSRMHKDESTAMRKLYFQSLIVMGLVSLVVFGGFVFILPFFIKLYMPNYIQAIPILLILSFSIPFMFLHSPAVQLLLSTDRFLKLVIIISIFTLSFNVVVNLILIPMFGEVGAAITTVASEILSFIIFYILVQRKAL